VKESIYHDLKSHDLWQKVNRMRRMYLLISLYRHVQGEMQVRLLHYLLASAYEKLYHNVPASTYNHLTALEEDMLKSILAGDTFEDFYSTAGQLHLKTF